MKNCRLKFLGLKANELCKKECVDCSWYEDKEKSIEVKKNVLALRSITRFNHL